jgi:hypothetical protein
MNRVTLRQHSPTGRPDLLGRHANRRLACSAAAAGEVTESGASGGGLLFSGSLLIHGRGNRPHKPPPRRRGRVRRLRSPSGGSRSVGADWRSRTARLTTQGWVEGWTKARLTVLLEPGRLGGCGEGRWRQRRARRGSRQALRGGSGHVTSGWTEGKRENPEYEVTETYGRKKRKLTRRPLE